MSKALLQRLELVGAGKVSVNVGQWTNMILKPRPSIYIGMTIGGVVVALIGFASATAVGGLFAIVPSVFGVLGVLWIVIGVWMLRRRSAMAIVITDDGIEMPSARVTRPSSPRFLIPRNDIATIAKSESMRGRGVEIVMKDGNKGFIQVRQYCEIDDFLSYCEKHNLTNAQPAAGGYGLEDSAKPSA